MSYAGATLCGILRKPTGAARLPMMVLFVGVASPKEICATIEFQFPPRDFANSIFDRPRRGKAECDLPILC